MGIFRLSNETRDSMAMNVTMWWNARFAQYNNTRATVKAICAHGHMVGAPTRRANAEQDDVPTMRHYETKAKR